MGAVGGGMVTGMLLMWAMAVRRSLARGGVGLRIHLEFAFVWMMMAMVSGLALLMAVFLLYLVLRGGL